MEVDPAIFILLLVFLLGLSALFSGSDMAFFAINNVILERIITQKTNSAKRVEKLLSRPRRLLLTLRVGDIFVNVITAVITTLFTISLFLNVGFNLYVAIILVIILITLLLFVIGELSLKIYAVHNAEGFVNRVSFIILGFYYLLAPFTILIDKILAFFIGHFIDESLDTDRFLKSSEVQAFLEIRTDQVDLYKNEQEMIHSIFEFGDTIVREIMVPRTDMICVAADDSLGELIMIIKEKGHTRIPVYQESVDEIRGVINAKDLLPFISNSKKDVDLLNLARPAIFIPETKKIDDLLRLFQKKRQHLAIVVDEYGGTSGLVTLEDVIEEIVGEIRDEYDNEQALYRKIDDKSYLINAKIDIESLNELLGLNIPMADDYDTLGGFIFQLLGAVPEQEQKVQYGSYEMIVKEVLNNRIIQVVISKIHHEEKNLEQ